MNNQIKSFAWSGRVDLEDGDQGLRVHQVIQQFDPKPGVCLIGLASDLGVEYNQGRVGAKEGPATFRRVLANLAWHFEAPLFDLGDHSICYRYRRRSRNCLGQL